MKDPMLKKRLVLEIDLHIDVDGDDELASDDTVLPIIEYEFNSRLASGGRPGFASELIREGLERIIKYSLQGAVYRECDEQHPNLGSLYKGMVKDTFVNFKHLRQTKHTHNTVDDALGNAEALLHMRDSMGLKISLE